MGPTVRLAYNGAGGKCDTCPHFDERPHIPRKQREQERLNPQDEGLF